MNKKLFVLVFFLLGFLQLNSQEVDSVKSSEVNSWYYIGFSQAPLNINNSFKQGIGQLDCIGFVKGNGDILYVGAQGGGLWKSADKAGTWSSLSNSLHSSSISEIVFDPFNSDIIYVATGDKNYSEDFSTGIYKSLDGGVIWNKTGLDFDFSDKKNVNCLLIDNVNSEILIAGTNYGIVKTNDGGNVWQTKLNNVEIKDIEINENVIFATSYNSNGGARILKSTDYGETFEYSEPTDFPYSEISRIELTLSPTEPNIIYAICVEKSLQSMFALYKSTNSGESWVKILDKSKQDLLSISSEGYNLEGKANNNIAIIVSSTNSDEIIIGGTHLWKSYDGGMNFVLLKDCYLKNSESVSANQHFLKQNPTNELFLGNDGGLYKSSDFGETWINISDGLQIMQSTNISIPKIKSEIFLSANRNVSPVVIDSRREISLESNSMYDCIFDYSNYEIIFSTTYDGKIYCSNDSGYSFKDITPFSDFSGIAPIAIDENNSNVIYSADNKIYKSSNRGDSWEILTENPQWTSKVRSIILCSNSASVFYITTNYGIWKTRDGGKNWTNITEGLPVNMSADNNVYEYYNLEVNTEKSDLIWVSICDYVYNQKVFKSENGGETWENISYSLPNLKMYSIKNQDGINNSLYLGSDSAVFYFDDELTDWICISENLPDVKVTDLEINYETNDLIISTYGRGIWKTKLIKYTNNAPVSNFTSSDFAPCLNEKVYLFDLSAYNPTSWKWEIMPNTLEFVEGTNEFSKNPIVEFKQNGVYNISLTTSNNYGVDSKTKSNFIFSGKPFSDFDFIVNNSDVVFVNNSFNYESSFWDFDDNSTSDLKNPVHNFTQNGVFSVNLKVNNECGFDVFSKNIIITSNNIEELSETVNIYPNPSSGKIKIQILNFQENAKLQIFDLKGVLVANDIIKFNDNFKEIDLKEGIYFCKIISDENQYSAKIIIQ